VPLAELPQRGARSDTTRAPATNQRPTRQEALSQPVELVRERGARGDHIVLEEAARPVSASLHVLTQRQRYGTQVAGSVNT